MLLVSFVLAVFCTIAYFNSSSYSSMCCNNVKVHDSTYLSIVASSVVGFVASLIQLILLIRNKNTNNQKSIDNTLDEINNLKSVISKFEFTLLELRKINKNLGLKLAVNSQTGLFSFNMNEYAYMQTIDTYFQNSRVKYDLIGERNTELLLNGSSNNSQFINYINDLIFENFQKQIDLIAGKLNALLGKYYTGLLDETIFDENKDGIVDYYVPIIMYYVAACYNLNDYNDYVYLVDYIIDNFC